MRSKSQRVVVLGRAAVLVATPLILMLAACSQQVSAPSADSGVPLAAQGIGNGKLWRFAGHDLSNTRDASTESKIDAANVATVTEQWALATGGEMSATPAVDGSAVYVPDWGGNLSKVDKSTGQVVWSLNIGAADGVSGDVATVTPAIYEGVLYLGAYGASESGAHVLAVDAGTGAVLWVTQVDSHAAARVSQSAAVFDGRVYVGVSSWESAFAADPSYSCCSFRGSVVALDAATGAIVWKTYTTPLGYPGVGVSGGMPAIDAKRNQLVVTTGSNTSVPSSVATCVADAGDDSVAVRACISPDDHFDSILALDLDSGAIRWATGTLPYDAYTDGCVYGYATCPSPAGPGYGFSQGAALFTVHPHGGPARDLVGAGQKSGQYWALDADTGAVVWETQVGPGGHPGGLVGGSAVDGTRVYVAEANSNPIPWTLIGGTTIESGFWTALDVTSGQILWQTGDPKGMVVTGPVSVANGVVYGGSFDGTMYAFDATTGSILWSFASGGSVYGGAAVVNGTVFWGSGHHDPYLPGTVANNRLYAFQLPK